MPGKLVIKLNELLSFIVGAIGGGLVAYPADYIYLVQQLGGAATQVSWLGLVLIAFSIYVFTWPPRFLKRSI